MVCHSTAFSNEDLDSRWQFLCFSFILFSDSTWLLPHKEKGSLLHIIYKNSATVRRLSFSRTDDCLHLTRHLLLSNGFYNVPILPRLVIWKAAVFLQSRAQEESCKVRYYQLVDHKSVTARDAASHKKPSIVFAKLQILIQQKLRVILPLPPLPNSFKFPGKWQQDLHICLCKCVYISVYICVQVSLYIDLCFRIYFNWLSWFRLG